MQHGQVDLCIVGTDRTTRSGDVCNKIGTYLKALAAHDNKVPFYAAVPSSSVDWRIDEGSAIPIEERSGDEVRFVSGHDTDGRAARVHVVGQGSAVANPAFDVTPRRLVTGLITERGIAEPSRTSLAALFPEHSR
jgi:methylthioribose-1-phosphate isomerase